MKRMNEFIEKIHLIPSIVISILTAIFGTHWILFAGYLFLNVLDFYTGRKKAKAKNELLSDKGWRGIGRKVILWVIVVVGFLVPTMLIELGNIIGIDLGVSVILGYLVLGSLVINEGNSIIENCVELGYEVPAILTKGLKVADEKLNGKNEETE